MADIVSAAVRSRLMSGIRGRNNRSTELQLIHLMKAAGLKGWRRHLVVPLGAAPRKSGPRFKPSVRPDFAFRAQRVAVFVDGCFWHGCPQHSTRPKTNATFWSDKIMRNRARDRFVSSALKKKGWQVVRIWEHQLTHADVAIRALRGVLSETRRGLSIDGTRPG